MKNKIILIFVLSISLLVGCGKKEPKQDVQPVQLSQDTIQLVVGNESVFSMRVPLNSALVYTDNSTYYEYANGVKIMSMHTVSHATEKYDKSLGVYYAKSEVSRDVGTGSVSIVCTEDSIDLYKNLLFEGNVVGIVDTFVKDKRIDVLSDSYENKAKEMQITENGNYMPMGSIESLDGFYTADLVTHDGKWCKSWIQDGKFEDIRGIINRYVYCTDGTSNLEFWFQPSSHDLLYVQTADAVIAAKALHLNAWTVYYTSTDYVDYVRTALDMVHAK